MQGTMEDIIRIRSEALTVTVSSQGAEMRSLQMADDGTELLWQADPAVWPRHAPHLFPIVGRLNDDLLHIDAKSYPMSQHGFARDNLFNCLEAKSAKCRFELKDSSESLTRYPFPFRLRIAYHLEGNTLTIEYNVYNPGETELPLSIGAHPAFNWPLIDGLAKGDHAIDFEALEGAPIRRLREGLLLNERFPSPLEGHRLVLRDELFADDAIIFDELASRSVSYGAQRGPRITVRFDDFPQLGIWTKPGANFICIEPWQGFASPANFDGDFRDKPGIVSVAPGETRRWRYSIQVDI